MTSQAQHKTTRLVPFAPRLTVSLTVLACLLGCPTDPTEELAATELRAQGRPERTSVILIVNDTMRRDRVGIYGGPAKTPHFDAFARENLLFDVAYSAAPWTKPSMATLFTSLYPSQHQMTSHPTLRPSGAASPHLKTDVLSDEFNTLAEILAGSGFKTAAFVGNPWMKDEFGFAQGFETYDDSFASWHVPGAVIRSKGLDWLKALGAENRFFLYLHFMDTHRPYPPLTRDEAERASKSPARHTTPLSRPGQRAIAEQVFLEGGVLAAHAGIRPTVPLLERAYDKGIEQFDQALGDFLTAFKSHEAYNRTAIIVVSDHGEALFARGWDNHGNGLYEDEVAIPLAARLPGVSSTEGYRIESPVSIADLLPTLTTYLQVDAESSFPTFGRDWLAPAEIEGRLADRYLVVEGVMNSPSHRAVRHQQYKAMSQPGRWPNDPQPRALFLPRKDPGEENDLLILGKSAAGTNAEARGIFDDLLRGGAKSVPEVAMPDVEQIPLDPTTVKRLKALGYIE